MKTEIKELTDKIEQIRSEIKIKNQEINNLKIDFVKQHRQFDTGETIQVTFPNHDFEELEIISYRIGINYMNEFDLNYKCKVWRRNGKNIDRRRNKEKELSESFLGGCEIIIKSMPHYSGGTEKIIVD